MLRIGMIGVGRWGKNHLRILTQMADARVTAVFDTDEKSRAYVRQSHPAVSLAQSPDEIFAGADAVVIATTSSFHGKLAAAALERGKHVFVEKPVSISLKEAKRIRTLAGKKRRVLQVGHLLLYHPAVRWLKAALGEGRLGRPLYLYSQRVNLGVVRRDENVVSSLATHDISVCLHLLEEFPSKVICLGRSYLQKNIEDVAFAILTFPSGAVAHFHMSWLDPHKTRKITLVGSKKMAVFDDMESEGKLKVFDKGVDGSDFLTSGIELPPAAVAVRYGDIYAPNLSSEEPLNIELSDFVRCCLKNKPPLADARNGVEVLAVMEGLQKSLRQGGKSVSVKHA